MQVIYIRNGSPRILIVPESELEAEILSELQGAEVSVLPDTAALLSEQVGRSLQIKPAGEWKVQKKNFFQRFFSTP